MGNEEPKSDKATCRLEALHDDHPTWNTAMEAWWKNGGALLWNQYGGMGSQVLILEPEKATQFLHAASLIEGWGNLSDGTVPWEESPARPVAVIAVQADDPNHEPEPEAMTTQIPSVVSILCCRQCGRGINPALRELWSGDHIKLSPRVMNHLLNSLQEAIDFARGEGPNNFRTWQASLRLANTVLNKKG